MDWKMIILALFFACLDGQRTDCNPFQINRLELYHMVHMCTFGPKETSNLDQKHILTV